MSRRPNLDEAHLWFDRGVHPALRLLYISSVSQDDEGESGTDFQMCERLLKGLALLEAASKEPVHAIMNNLGGNNYHAFAMYDALWRSPCHITVTGTGYVMSAGVTILQAADVRRLTPNAALMVHYGQFADAGVPGVVLPSVESWKQQLNWLEALFLKRIQEKQPAFKLRDVKRMLSKDTYFSAEEAVEMGLADEITEV